MEDFIGYWIALDGHYAQITEVMQEGDTLIIVHTRGMLAVPAESVR